MLNLIFFLGIQLLNFPEITVSSSIMRCKRTELGPEPQTSFISVRMSELQTERTSRVPLLNLNNLQIYNSVSEAQAYPHTLIEYGRKIIGAVAGSWQET